MPQGLEKAETSEASAASKLGRSRTERRKQTTRDDRVFQLFDDKISAKKKVCTHSVPTDSDYCDY